MSTLPPCASDPEKWFSGNAGTQKAAAADCAPCPMRLACLQQAIDDGEEYGVWGGTTEQQRDRLGPNPLQAKPVICPACKAQDNMAPNGVTKSARWLQEQAACNECGFTFWASKALHRVIKFRIDNGIAAPKPAPLPKNTHGHYATYAAGLKCRCQPCTDAWAEYCRNLATRKGRAS